MRKTYEQKSTALFQNIAYQNDVCDNACRQRAQIGCLLFIT